jgi:hypothetical protein
MEFLFKYKKILIILGFFIFIILFGYLIFHLFFKSLVVSQPTRLIGRQTTTTPIGLPQAGTSTGVSTKTGTQQRSSQPAELPKTAASPVARGGLTQTTPLNKTPSLGATLSADGNSLQYYNPQDGKFYRISEDGKITPLVDKIFHQVQKITWSSNKEKAILEYPDGANIIYDFKTKKQITLPKHWQDFDFSPNGKKIAMKSIGLDPGNRWLAVTNADGTQVHALESLGNNADCVHVAWSPNNQIVAMFTEGIDFDRQNLYFVGLHNENFKSTVIEGRGFQGKWSPEGNKLLYSVYSSHTNQKPNLWIVDAQGDNIGRGRKNLKINTWANKCTYINNAEVYCAVPEELPEGAGMFPELAASTKDRLYKINTITGLKKLIAVPDGTYNMSNLVVSENGYYLYFTDKITKQIYKIKLK